MVPTRLEVLKLYKELLRYGEILVFTDKNYYKGRIKNEFKDNRHASEEDVQFLYKRGKVLLEKKRIV